MPGSAATLVTCWNTLSSMSRMRSSVAKITAGTRMAPVGATRHSVAEMRSRSLTSTVASLGRLPTSDVDDALSQPTARLPLLDLELGQRGALDLDRRHVPLPIDPLAPGNGCEPRPFDRDREGAEEHAAGRHLEHERIEPLVKQEVELACRALDADRFAFPDEIEIRDHGRHGQRGLGEGVRRRRAPASDSDVRIVGEMLPAGGLGAARGGGRAFFARA